MESARCCKPFIPTLIIANLFFGGALYFLWQERDLICVFNKENGVFLHFRQGFLGTPLNRVTLEQTLAEITAVEKRHFFVGEWQHRLRVFVVMNDSKRLPISGQMSSFSECEKLADKVHKFLGNEIAVVDVERERDV